MKKLQNEQGFTLIEIVVALGVLAFGILSLMLLQTSGIRGNTTADITTVATNDASNQIEKILGLSYDDSLLETTTVRDPLTSGSSGWGEKTKNWTCTGTDVFSDTGDEVDHCIANGDYSIFWTISTGYPIPNTKTIQMFVKQTANVTEPVVFEYIKSNL
ncbi:prepilin-type N-terminal cleavage/methylation domain-containing protein [Desulforhopalus vacuolatus]|uniref:type IV pilus modification PilV family protein n=1 Tax=Desulforhopalus vacuolatus TaxID=40414 RepID=UPI001964E2C3|nr:prepilin-type N-terminal cleavage/methylation domain-containing protein [Desulforhopalus vacuolatus]MBM9521188.1 prepilin-type N-terminal cleavage/methylation domain-containing protein [Desulforhopalus vacuolatus]